MTNSNQSLAEIEQNDFVNFEEIERELEKDINEGLKDLSFLQEEREKIGNPNSLGSVVKDVIWDQFINQIGQYAGEEFIKENRGLTLDLRKDAHIQTTSNFEKGNIASHNKKIDYQQRYNDFRSNFYFDENGKIITKYDRIDNEEKPVLRPGYRKPYDTGRNKGSASVNIDETVSVAEQVRNPAANAHLSLEERVAFDQSEKNLNPMDSSANQSKSDHKAGNWLNSERNGQKPSERFNIDEEQIREKDREARAELEKQIADGEKRSVETGKQSQIEEAKRAGTTALKAVLMSMLAELVKKIIQKFIKWLQSAKKNIKTLAKYVKDAILDFVKNLKSTFFSAGNSIVAAISTAIVGPVVTLIKKAMIFLKQGWKSLKDAVAFLKDPNNKALPFGIRVLEVGKIVVAGFTGASAIILGEAFEVGLKSIPGAGAFFSFEIPLLGSIANILGIFFGAVVSGVIGAIALNLIDKLIAKHQLNENQRAQIEKRNEILTSQKKLNNIVSNDTSLTAVNAAESIGHRHQQAANYVDAVLAQIDSNTMQVEIDEQVSEDYAEPDVLLSSSTEEDEYDDILNKLKTMSKKM